MNELIVHNFSNNGSILLSRNQIKFLMDTLGFEETFLGLTYRNYGVHKYDIPFHFEALVLDGYVETFNVGINEIYYRVTRHGLLALQKAEKYYAK